MSQLEPYQLVSFTDSIINGLRSVKCVPNSWISYDTKIGSCMVRYKEPPYGDEDKKLIQDLIKNMSDPPERWPLYQVSLQGHATTYSEGLKKIKKLRTQEFAYTTATENEGKKKSKAITNSIKNADLKGKSIKDFLSRKNLSSDNESEAESLNSEHCKPTDESSSESEPVRPKSSANYDGKNKTKDTLKKSAISSSIHGQSSASTSYSINAENITAGKKATEKLKTSKVLPPSKYQKSVYKENIPTNLSGHGDQDQRNKDQFIDENEVNNVFTSKSDAILHELMKLVTVVKSQGQEIQKLRYTLERSLRTGGCRITTNTFVEKYDFEKIRSVADFRAFDNRLKEDEDFRNDFSAAIDCIAVPKMTKTINAVLNTFFTQEFALKCTTVRESKKKGEKVILKRTQFYEQLLEFVRRIYSVEETVTEIIYNQNLAMCLNNLRKMSQQDL